MQDLWHIGKAIGLPEFDDSKDQELDEMNKSLARAKCEDMKALKGRNEELRGQMGSYLGGEREMERIETHSQFASAKWIQKIWDKYQGAVIWRTVNSLDYMHNPISGLEPYEEHQCVITMYNHEYAALEQIAAKASDDESFMKQFASEVKQSISVSLKEETDEA